MSYGIWKMKPDYASEAEPDLNFSHPSGQRVDSPPEIHVLNLGVVLVGLEGLEVQSVEQIVSVSPYFDSGIFSQKRFSWKLEAFDSGHIYAEIARAAKAVASDAGQRRRRERSRRRGREVCQSSAGELAGSEECVVAADAACGRPYLGDRPQRTHAAGGYNHIAGRASNHRSPGESGTGREYSAQLPSSGQ